MVRAGVVAHPSEREFGGYAEAAADRERGSITDFGALLELSGADSIEAPRMLRSNRVEEPLANGDHAREGNWTESGIPGRLHSQYCCLLSLFISVVQWLGVFSIILEGN